MKASIIALVLISPLFSLAADHPSVEALARDYLTAVRQRNADAVRALFPPPAAFTKSDKERRYIEDKWVQASLTIYADLPESVRIDVTRFEDSGLTVHAPWRWPLQPTHVIKIAAKSGEYRGTTEAAVEHHGRFYLIRPLPPESEMK